jgi:hypothetical protein
VTTVVNDLHVVHDDESTPSAVPSIDRLTGSFLDSLKQASGRFDAETRLGALIGEVARVAPPGGGRAGKLRAVQALVMQIIESCAEAADPRPSGCCG